MKMQNEIAAPAEGVVEAVHVAEGQAIESGARLVTLAAVEAE
jgi:biotin carboxyl carrier protein